MLPHLEQMSQELGDSVKVVKFNCSKENKDLGKSLGIRVAPTFHLYRKSEKVRCPAPFGVLARPDFVHLLSCGACHWPRAV